MRQVVEALESMLAAKLQQIDTKLTKREKSARAREARTEARHEARSQPKSRPPPIGGSGGSLRLAQRPTPMVPPSDGLSMSGGPSTGDGVPSADGSLIDVSSEAYHDAARVRDAEALSLVAQALIASPSAPQSYPGHPPHPFPPFKSS